MTQDERRKQRERADQEKTDEEICRQNWERYQYSKASGHDVFVETALRNDDFFLGGGKQWTDADRAARGNRPTIEINHVMPAVETALGLQLHSRVDMSFLPRGEGADQEKAETLSKVVRAICDDVEYHWHESQQYSDGLIEQRGFLEFRIDWSRNILGEIVCELLDPCDCHPDPDSQSYMPKHWGDFIITRWLDADEISLRYGADKLRELEQLADAYFEDDNYQDRQKFGEDADGTGYMGWVKQDGEREETRKYLIVDRQKEQLVRDKVFVYWTGEMVPVSQLGEERLQQAINTDMGMTTVADHRRIKWTVTSGGVVLFNDWSPYRSKTVIPYFFIFRRGRTRGMVDNLRSPQELENKSVSNDLEIQNTIANSGWDVEEGSLTNMSTDDLQRYGAKNGLVVEYKKGYNKPERRQPMMPPAGAERLADRAELAIKSVSGMSDAQQGQPSREVSGKALQSKQFMGQMQLGSPLDNLALTRRLAARKIVELVQDFYTSERVFRITDPDTNEIEEDLTINQVQPDGSILNDLTIGKYDVVITDTPTTTTFEQSQFMEMMEMLERGVPVPQHHVIKASSLAKKHEIVEEMLAAKEQEADPEIESKVAENMASADYKTAQAEKVRADMVNSGVDAMYSAIQTAGVIATTPQTANLADRLLLSAGYEDKDKPPIVPELQANQQLSQAPQQPLEQQLPPNTNPTTPVPPQKPASPAVGANQGIETQEID